MCFDTMDTMKSGMSTKSMKSTKTAQTASKARPYVGIRHPKTTEMVMSPTKVTTTTHPKYHTVKGPFKTKRGANFLATHKNPKAMSELSVSELEKLAQEMGIGSMSTAV